jgi:virulence-associated protein VagC
VDILIAMSAARGKLLRSGSDQAVHLPQEFRFPEGQSEVLVRREGNRVILEPIDEWPEDFRACLGAWTAEIERSEQSLLGDLRDPFA